MNIINRIKRIWYRVNPKYKDRLFCTIFGKERYKRYALDLYNAVNNSHHTDLSDLEIVTLENVIYIKAKNDAAYLIGGNVALYEHQSSINNNMPVRGFIYMGELYSQILKRGKKNIYNKTLVKIPAPQYIVFYNGTEDYPEVSKLRLSDAFINPRNDGEFEFTATVYNINLGKNSKLLDSCEPLKGYSIFIDKVRTYSETMDSEKAVDKAVNECINEGILRDILERERASVMLDILTSFDKKSYEEGLREEGREEERARTEAERANTERERKRAIEAEEELARYREKFGPLS